MAAPFGTIMSYTLKTDDPDIAHGFRRVAADQLDGALDSLEGRGDADVHEAVHDARKRCKKLRGLIRLFRGAFPGYGAENAAIRDAARHLSDLRDKTAMIETYDRLMDRYGGALNRPSFAPLRAGFTRDRGAAGEAGDLDARRAAMAEALRAVRGRVETWQLKAGGVAAVEDGMTKSYARARAAMEAADAAREPEALHEWRKRVKYHWYHMRLLSGAKAEAIDARAAAADELSDILGDHHDLVELLPRLEAASLGAVPTRVMRGLVREEMARLEDEAFVVGRALFARKPKTAAKELRKAVKKGYSAA